MGPLDGAKLGISGQNQQWKAVLEKNRQFLTNKSPYVRNGAR